MALQGVQNCRLISGSLSSPSPPSGSAWVYPQHGKNLQAAQLQIVPSTQTPAAPGCARAGLSQVWDGCPGGKVQQQSLWSCLGQPEEALQSHNAACRDISGTWQCFECCVQSGEDRQTAVVCLVQDSSDEIPFLGGCASPWEQGLGAGVMSGCC